MATLICRLEFHASLFTATIPGNLKEAVACLNATQAKYLEPAPVDEKVVVIYGSESEIVDFDHSVCGDLRFDFDGIVDALEDRIAQVSSTDVERAAHALCVLEELRKLPDPDALARLQRLISRRMGYLRHSVDTITSEVVEVELEANRSRVLKRAECLDKFFSELGLRAPGSIEVAYAAQGWIDSAVHKKQFKVQEMITNPPRGGVKRRTK